MTQTPRDWTASPEAKLLVSSILARYHKTRMADTDVHGWILGCRTVQSALTALSGPPAPPDGCPTALRQLGKLLRLPRLRAALQNQDPEPDYRAMLAATARYITHDRECATVALHGGHLCSCGASAAARDAHAAQSSESGE